MFDCTTSSFHILDEERFECAGTECVVREVSSPIGRYHVGYAKVPEGHRDFGIDYMDDGFPYEYNRSCGEVTYTDDLDRDGGWWIGFDTAHLGDDRSREYAVETASRLAETVMRRGR